MCGTKAGGRKAAATNKAKYGDDFYVNLGRIGGKRGHAGGFAVTNAEGVHELAQLAGARGAKKRWQKRRQAI